MHPTDPALPRRRRVRKRRASIRVFLGTRDRLRLDRFAASRGAGPATIVRTLVVDGLDRHEGDAAPVGDWRPLVNAPTGTHDRRRYSPHLRLVVLLRIIGTERAATLLATYGGSRLPSARVLGRELRRRALLAAWARERWSHPRYLARLAGMFGLTPGQVRRIIGPRYWTKRRASYAKRVGELREREEAAGVVRTPTARLSIRVLA